MRQSLTWIISALALVIAVVALNSGGAEPPVGDRAAAAGNIRLERIERAIEALAIRIEAVSLAGPAESPPIERAVAADHDPLPGLADKIAQLTERMDGIEREPDEPEEIDDVMRAMFERQRSRNPIDLAALKAAASDPGQSEESRLQALRSLRGVDGGRSPEIVASMAELAQTTVDPEVRADVFRQLHGVSDESLKLPLVNALLHDLSPLVRAEAAETLDQYLGDPWVMNVLKQARESDADAGVVSQILETLDQG